MRTRLKYLFKITFIGFLLLSTEISHAQRKNIIINNELSNNAEMMKVKMANYNKKPYLKMVNQMD